MSEEERKKFNEAAEKHRLAMQEIIGKGNQAQYNLMALVLLARAEVSASVKLIDSLIECLPQDYRPTVSAAAEFQRIRAEEVDRLLLQLGDTQPDLYNELKRIVGVGPQS